MMHHGNPFALPRPAQVRWVTDVYDQDTDPAAAPDDARSRIYDGANELARRVVPTQGGQQHACSGYAVRRSNPEPVPCWLPAKVSMILQCNGGHEWSGDYCDRHVQALRNGAGLDKVGHTVEVLVEIPL